MGEVRGSIGSYLTSFLLKSLRRPTELAPPTAIPYNFFMPFKRLLIFLLTVLPAPLTAQSQSENLLQSLQPEGYVSDYSGLLNAQERQDLERLLEELDRKSGAQIALVILPSLLEGEIRDFTNRLFEKWGIGRRGEDRGILVLAAIEDRRIWIEVGYGLEGILPDSRVGRILDESVIPLFRQEQYAAGLITGVSVLAGIVAEDAGIELSGDYVAGGSQRRMPPKLSCLEMLVGGIFLLLLIPILVRHPWILFFLLSSAGRGGGFSGGGFGQGGGFGGFGGGLSGGGGAGRSW